MTDEERIAFLLGEDAPAIKSPLWNIPLGDVITTDALADLIDLSPGRVLGLARSGDIPRVTAGRFNRREAVRAYIRYVKSNPVGRKSADPALAGQVRPTRIETYADHRIAMSFALAGLRLSDITILDPDCVAKTFPAYWDTLATLGVTTKA